MLMINSSTLSFFTAETDIGVVAHGFVVGYAVRW